jgi:hypothetical protein
VVGYQPPITHSDLPGQNWTLDDLAAYAKGQIAESALQAHKSAVALFRAGCALFHIRNRCMADGHGRWTGWLRDHGLGRTTVNDAIRLFENAERPDALAGLGITEAKRKFVYPKKAEAGETNGREDSQTSATEGVNRPEPGAARSGRGRGRAASQRGPASGEPLEEELDDIAQRVTEIAQDDFGKVRDVKRVENAVLALDRAAGELLRWLNTGDRHA